jgi:hypothetical protein
MFAKKYKKIELLFKDSSSSSRDKLFVPTTKLSYEECGMYITGETLVIVKDILNQEDNSISNEGWIYPLKELTAYKTYN